VRNTAAQAQAAFKISNLQATSEKKVQRKLIVT
jgi:hypothetical protein